jgi:hypothetical protein
MANFTIKSAIVVLNSQTEPFKNKTNNNHKEISGKIIATGSE